MLGRMGSELQLENRDEVGRARRRKEIQRKAGRRKRTTGRGGWPRFLLNSLRNLQASPSVFSLLKHTHHKEYFRHIKTEVISLMSGPASFKLGPGSCGPFHAGVGGILSSPPFPPHPRPGSHLPCSGLGPKGPLEAREAATTQHFWGAPGAWQAEWPACVLMGGRGGACFQEDPGVEKRLCVPRFLSG